MIGRPQRDGQPRVIAFYAFKGGTGRSFALAHTGWYFARMGHRVVVVDLDLAAPGLWPLLSPRQDPAPGVIEYLAGWTRRQHLDARDLLEEVPLDAKAKGALFLLQAGSLDANYVNALQTLDWSSLLTPADSGTQMPLFGQPLDGLFADIQSGVEPDLILIDAPTGYNDTSNLCLRVLADVAVLLFAPSRVHLDGIGRVVAALTSRDARPDVFCVASTILLSRLGGTSVRRITDAFAYLDRVRYEKLGRPETLDQQADDLVHQQPAVISYDERLAELERLPTTEEPRKAHFAVFQELLDYIQGVLPAPTPHVDLATIEKQPLIEELRPRFEPFAEQGDHRIEELFLRTDHVNELDERRVALVLGGKGSGKTALFLYYTRQRAEASAAHGPGIGLSSDILCALQDTVTAFDTVWRSYLLTRLDPGLPFSSDPMLIEILTLLRRVSEDPGPSIKRLGEIHGAPDVGARLHQAWTDLDRAIGKRVVLCIDGLDTVFKSDLDRRDRGLAALMTAWQTTFSKLDHIEVKLFLRNDIWDRLSFPEKSHLRPRILHLNWDERNLWRLVVKRALAAPSFMSWAGRCLPPPLLEAGQAENAALEQLGPYLDLLLERHIWTGKNSLSRNWILRRLADARSTTFPRDLICLLREAMDLEEERVREKARVTNASILSRQSLADALLPTSKQRVEAVQEEFPELRDVFPAMSGLEAAGQTKALEDRLEVSFPGKTPVVLKVLVDASVVRIGDEGYQVPDLYRHGLDMPRPGPR